MMNGDFLPRLFSYTVLSEGIAILLIYVIIAVVEFVGVPYEQFYLVEEESHILLIAKATELCSFYLFFLLFPSTKFTAKHCMGVSWCENC